MKNRRLLAVRATRYEMSSSAARPQAPQACGCSPREQNGTDLLGAAEEQGVQTCADCMNDHLHIGQRITAKSTIGEIPIRITEAFEETAKIHSETTGDATPIVDIVSSTLDVAPAAKLYWLRDITQFHFAQ
jgi:hypothetical protein